MFGTECKGCSSDASAAAAAAADARDCRGTRCNCLIIIHTDDAEHVRAAHITACCTMLQPPDAEPRAPVGSSVGRLRVASTKEPRRVAQ